MRQPSTRSLLTHLFAVVLGSMIGLFSSFLIHVDSFKALSLYAVVCLAIIVYYMTILANNMRGAWYLTTVFLAIATAQTVNAYTGFPYGPVAYTEAVTAPYISVITAVLSVAPIIVLVSRYYTDGFDEAWQRILLSTVLYTGISMVAAPIGISLQLWTWATTTWYYGVPAAGLTGSLLLGVVTAIISEEFDPVVPKTALLPATTFYGFLAGTATANSLILPLLLSFVMIAYQVYTVLHD